MGICDVNTMVSNMNATLTALLTVVFACFRASAAPLNGLVSDGGAPLWVDYVTAGRKPSIWSNKAQLEDEAQDPDLPTNQTHPWALQTRWHFTPNVAGAPPEMQFVMIEMGSTPSDGKDDSNIVLFGITTAARGAAQLASFKAPQITDAVNALHADGTTTKPLISFSALQQDNVTILYEYTSANASFFGVGGGSTPDGGRIQVQETVAQNLVAPLEVFYDAQGKCYTDYVTPLRYHYHDH